jgi:hypothetical protein
MAFVWCACAPAGDATPLVFGVFPYLPAAKLEAFYAPIAADLSGPQPARKYSCVPGPRSICSGKKWSRSTTTWCSSSRFSLSMSPEHTAISLSPARPNGGTGGLFPGQLGGCRIWAIVASKVGGRGHCFDRLRRIAVAI